MDVNQVSTELLELTASNECAYNNYISQGRTLKFASVLKTNNDRIVVLLEFLMNSDTDLVVRAAKEWHKHLTCWRRQWEALSASRDFDLHEKFVFETAINFPEKQVKQLLQFCEIQA